jgi:hypothetical protein
MSASREFFYPSDDFIVISANIDGSPLVDIPFTELFDSATFTVVENYLQVLHDYVIELLEDTAWMDAQSFLYLLGVGYDIYHDTDTGGCLAMQKAELQLLFLKTLRHGNDNDHPFVVPLRISFLVPDIDEPGRATLTYKKRHAPNFFHDKEEPSSPPDLEHFRHEIHDVPVISDLPQGKNDTQTNKAEAKNSNEVHCLDCLGNIPPGVRIANGGDLIAPISVTSDVHVKSTDTCPRTNQTFDTNNSVTFCVKTAPTDNADVVLPSTHVVTEVNISNLDIVGGDDALTTDACSQERDRIVVSASAFINTNTTPHLGFVPLNTIDVGHDLNFSTRIPLGTNATRTDKTKEADSTIVAATYRDGGNSTLYIDNLSNTLDSYCQHSNNAPMMTEAMVPGVNKNSVDKLWTAHATIMCPLLCRSMLLLYQPIDRGRHFV